MKQIIQSYKNGNITLGEVPAPACKAGGVLVRNVASLISPGTEKMMIEMGQKTRELVLSRFTWDKVAQQTIALCEELLAKA